MKILVLAGGLSPERDVSLSSGALIANSLIDSGYEVMLLDLYLGVNNKDIIPKYISKKNKERFSYKVKETEPDLNKLKEVNGENPIGEGVIEECQKADVVFMALHGGIGENGQLQAVFDKYSINYTGSSSEGSNLAMNKNLSKKVMVENNILTAKWICTTNDIDIEKIKFPCVVKPCSCGSSVGTSLVKDKKELEKAIEYAKEYEDDIIVEDFIEGREFSVGILDNKALPVIEIKPIKGFYDYKNKYQTGCTIETCPAEIDIELKSKLQNEALKVHNALKLGFYSRIDFIVDKNNNPYCLEANTLPGMTPTSLLPQEAQAEGITYSELCEKIVLSTVKNK